MAPEPIHRDLAQHPRPNSGEEVHGPKVSRRADLEGNTAPQEWAQAGRGQEREEGNGTQKPTDKSKSDISNKKAEVIAMLRRAKVRRSTRLWRRPVQKLTVRGFVSILGSKGGLSIGSSKNAAGAAFLRLCSKTPKRRISEMFRRLTG